jgi:hypothetical protein
LLAIGVVGDWRCWRLVLLAIGVVGDWRCW